MICPLCTQRFESILNYSFEVVGGTLIIKKEVVEKRREEFESDEKKVCPACKLVALEGVYISPDKK